MGWLDFIFPGISALSGALSNRSKTQTTNQNYSNTYSNTTTPQVPAEQAGLYSTLVGLAQKRLAGQTPLYGYEANGLQNINSTADAVGNSIRNRLVASGQYGGPGADTALNSLDVSRGAQAAQFRNSLPLLQNSLDLQNLGAAGTIFGLGPKGQTSTGTSSGSETNVTNYPGNVAGGALGGLGSALGFLIGQGAFGQGTGGEGGGSTGGGGVFPVGPYGTGSMGGGPTAGSGTGGMDTATLIKLLGGLNLPGGYF